MKLIDKRKKISAAYLASMNYNHQKVSNEIIRDGTHYLIMNNWNITSVPNRVVKIYLNSIMNYVIL